MNEIDPDAVAIARRIHETHPIAFMAKDAIRKHILSGDITLSIGSEHVDLSQQASALFEKYWKPFLSDVIDAIMVYGVVPVAFCNMGADIVPRVPQMGTYTIKIDYDTETESNEYVFYRTVKRRGRDDSVVVVGGWGYDPDPNGALRSPLRSLVEQTKFIDEIQRLAVLGEQVRAAPAIIAEVKQGFFPSSLSQGVFGDADRAQISADDKYARSALDIMQLVHQRKRLHHAVDGDPDYDETQLQPVHPLPVGLSSTSNSFPSLRSDLHILKVLDQATVAAVYGVPRSIIMSEGGQRSGFASIHMESFKQTLLYWKSVFTRLLTGAYYQLYTDTDRALYMQQMRGNPLSPEDINAVQENTQPFMTITIPSFVGDEKLIRRYALGIMSFDDFAREMQREIHMPLGDTTQPLPREALFKKINVSDVRGDGSAAARKGD